MRRLRDDGNTAFQPRMLPGMSLEISGKSAQRIGGDVPNEVYRDSSVGIGALARTSVGEAAQGADTLRGRRMAAQETHWIVLACIGAQDRRPGVMAFQLVERRDQRC